MPEPFRGTSDKETIEKLYKDIAGRPKPPAKPEDYKFELPPEHKDFLIADSDPALPILRKVAHELQMPNDQFNKMVLRVQQEMRAAGIIEAPLDPHALFASLAPASVTDPRTKVQEGARRVQATGNWVKSLVTKQVLTQTEANTLGALAISAEGVAALEKVMKLTGEAGYQLGGAPPAGAQSREELNRMMMDERYSTQSPKYDATFRRQVDDAWKKLPSGRQA